MGIPPAATDQALAAESFTWVGPWALAAFVGIVGAWLIDGWQCWQDAHPGGHMRQWLVGLAVLVIGWQAYALFEFSGTLSKTQDLLASLEQEWTQTHLDRTINLQVIGKLEELKKEVSAFEDTWAEAVDAQNPTARKLATLQRAIAQLASRLDALQARRHASAP